MIPTFADKQKTLDIFRIVVDQLENERWIFKTSAGRSEEDFSSHADAISAAYESLLGEYELIS